MAIKIEGFDTASGGGGGAGAIRYAGTYNATTNTPDLTSSLLGDQYYIEVGGTLAGVTLDVGDFILFNQNASSPITAAMFNKLDSTDKVDSVNGQVGAVVLDTDDISETATNQYFTSARFTSQFNTKTTDNLTEGSSNQYFTTARFDTQFNTKDTDNLTEGSTNQYFTNTRADARISAANLTSLNDVDYTAGAGIDGRVLTYVNANNRWEAVASPSAPVTSVNTQTGAVVLDSDDVSEGSTNQYFTTARFDTQFNTKDTDNLTEGSSNQYFTNTRADARISAANLTSLNDVDYTAGAGIDGRVLTYVNANNRWEAVASPSAPVTSVNTQTGAVVLDSDDVSEGSTNQYFTTARFDTQFNTKDTDNLTEGSSNQYFTNTRADARISAANLTSLNDVDYTAGAGIDGRVLTYVNSNSRWEAVASPSAPVTSVNTQTGAVVLDSDDVSEGSTNQYFTTARFDTQFNTKDTDNLTEGSSNQYFTNTRADARISAANLTSLNDVDYTAGAGIDGRVLTYVNANSRWEAVAQTTNIVEDTSPELGGDLDVNGQDIISVSNGNIELAPDGSGQVKIKGNATGGSGQIVLNCEQNSHGITLKGPPHSAQATYTLTFPNNDGDADQVLKTDGSGNLSWIDQASGGGGGFTYSAITSASSPVSGAVEYHYSANTSGGAITINLPAIAAGNAGKEIRVKLKTAGNNLVLSPNGTNQVEAGGAGVDYTLTVQNTAITLVSDGSANWEII